MSDPAPQDSPPTVEEGEEVTIDQVMLKGLVILPPRQKVPNAALAAKHSVHLPTLRADEPVQSLRGALADVIGYSHLTNYRFEVAKKLPDNQGGEAPPIVSPFTGKGAVVSVSVGVKSLDSHSFKESVESAASDAALDDYGNLIKLVEDGVHDKDPAFEVVLERYNIGSIKDHVNRLRSLLSGNLPSITTLVEEETSSGDEDKDTDGGASKEKKKQEEGKKSDGKADKPMPPLPNYSAPASDSKTPDGTLNLKDFFYRVSGEDRSMYGENAAARSNLGNASKSSKKKKKGKSKGAKPNSNNGTETKEESPEVLYSKLIPQWNKLDEEAMVPFAIKYSAFHPPPPSRRWMGDLAYLELTPSTGVAEASNGSSNPTVHITATPTGFYVNKSRIAGGQVHFDPSPASDDCFSHSLLDCLLQASTPFCDAWSKALDASKERSELMKMISQDTSLSLFRVAVRGDFAGFSNAASASHIIQQTLDSMQSTPSWIVPRPTEYPGADADSAWTGNQFHSNDENRREDDLVNGFGVDVRNGGIRDWNEELQITREMPTESHLDRVERARLLYKVMTEFGDAALSGVKAICDGQLAAFNPEEGARSQVFMHNNIFFSRAVDNGPETFKLVQGDRAARKSASRDIQCIATLHRAEKSGLCTLATVLIDYLGSRFVCQSILPGLLIGQKGHKVLFGTVDIESPLQWDESLHKQLLTSVGGPMMVAARPVLRNPSSEERVEEMKRLKKASPYYPELKRKDLDEDIPENAVMETCIPIESKCILGSDQRQYLLDIGRLTPRDANWVPESEGGSGKYEAAYKELNAKSNPSIPAALNDDEWAMHVLRPELVSRFTKVDMTKFMNEKKAKKQQEEEAAAVAKENEKGEDAAKLVEAENENENKSEKTAEEDVKKSTLEKEDLEHLESLKLNINVFLPYMKTLEGINEEAMKQLKQDEALVRDVSSFLWDEVLPNITRGVKDTSVQPLPMEGKSLTEFLHRNGVNCRYMGRLAHLAKEEETKDLMTETGMKEGKLTVVQRRTMPKCWLELLECEMVARAAKHVLDSYLSENGGIAAVQPTQTISSFLSALVSERQETASQTESRLEKRSPVEPDEDDISGLAVNGAGGYVDDSSKGIRGRQQVWKDIEAEIGRRFRYTLTLYNSGNASGRALYIPLLRRVCQRTGVRLVSKNYNVGANCLCAGGNTTVGDHTPSYPISPLDIVDIVPLMKHTASYREGFTPCLVGSAFAMPALQVSLRDARLSLEHAHIQMSQRALGKALELAQEAASLYQRVTDNPAHPGIIESIDLMANIFLEAGEPELAAANAAKALALSIQSNGFDSSATYSSHMTLFQMYLASRDMERAIKHWNAAIYILEITAGPRHSDAFSLYHKLGSIYSHESYNGKYFPTALTFFEEAAKRDCCDRLMHGIISKSHAKILAELGRFKEATEAEKKAYHGLSMFLGKDHQLTAESDKELQKYAAHAVKQGNKIIDKASYRHEEEKADAMAAALLAEEEQKEKKNKKKKGKR